MDQAFYIHAINPVAFQIGPLGVKWYSLAYFFGVIIGWQYCKVLLRKYSPLNPRKSTASTEIDNIFDNFIIWIILGIILGGRIGYILFYNLHFYLSNPFEIFAIWHGGMSFHGGLIGVLAATAIYSSKNKIQFFPLADLIACVSPIGLFLGRVANFINGELVGKITDTPWAVIFPKYDYNPRHPSQLYEAMLEGVVLFVLLQALILRFKYLEKPGMISGIFLIGYGIFRITIEYFREPDLHLGYVFNTITMGQLLTLPVLVCGVWILYYAKRKMMI
jgi:phosphatidylglycerol:prolipoprotein diacylglycerol transferase|tara:strand:+ start:914 stop:1741 length:828 start_codon:yes stop_codon:yes gene_type:complete